MVKATEVTAGLAESNGSLPASGWLKSPAGFLPVHLDQLRDQRVWENITTLFTAVSRANNVRAVLTTPFCRSATACTARAALLMTKSRLAGVHSSHCRAGRCNALGSYGGGV